MHKENDTKDKKHDVDMNKKYSDHDERHKQFMEIHKQVMDMADKIKKYACGGEVEHLAEGGMPEQQLPTVEPVATQAQPAQTLAPQQQAPAQVAEMPQEPVAPPTAQERYQQIIDSAPIQMGQTPGLKGVENNPEAKAAYQNWAKEHSQWLGEQAAKSDQDFASGHIQPKTYADLFADKSTLGKVSTLFGLLVGGAGAGLAHQENAVMKIMDNQIQKDFEAQQKSKDNAINFVKVNQEAIPVMATANAMALTQTYQATYHHLLEVAKRAPPQEQNQMLKALESMRPILNDKIADINALATAHVAAQGGNPFKQNAPQGVQQNRSAGGMKKHNSGGVSASDHILSPSAQQVFTKAQYRPEYNDDKDEVRKQLELAALADKAIDSINEHFPQMVANTKNIPHASLKNQDTLSSGFADKVLNVGSDISGYIHRKSHNLTAIPYVGEAIGGAGETITDTQKNRDYDVHRAPVETAMTNVLTKAGMSPTQAQKTASSIMPEIGDSMEMAKNKLKAAIEKMRTNVPTNALERHGLSKKSK